MLCENFDCVEDVAHTALKIILLSVWIIIIAEVGPEKWTTFGRHLLRINLNHFSNILKNLIIHGMLRT